MNTPFKTYNVRHLLTEYRNHHFNAVFFWEEDPPDLFLHDYNNWCYLSGRTDLLFLIGFNQVSQREYLDALDIRYEHMRGHGYSPNATFDNLPEFVNLSFYNSLFPFLHYV